MSCFFSINQIYLREKDADIENQQNGMCNGTKGSSKSDVQYWISLGDCFYYFCDSEKPLNFFGVKLPIQTAKQSLTNTSSPSFNLSVKFSHNIIDVFTAKTLSHKLCFVVLSNGEIHAHTYDRDIQKWVFDLILKLKSNLKDDSSSENGLVKSVTFDDDFTSIIWCQTNDPTSAFGSALFYRQISLTPLKSIPNLSVNSYPSVCILNRCPELNVTYIDGFISCLLHETVKIGVFITWSRDSQLSLRDTSGNVLQKFSTHNVDFSEILSDTVGLWTDSWNLCTFQMANKVCNILYVLTSDFTVLSLNKSDGLCAKIKLSTSMPSDSVKGFVVYGLMVVLFTYDQVFVYSLECGEQLFDLSLSQYEPLTSTWYFSTATSSSFGFYGHNSVFQFVPKSYEESLVSCDFNCLLENENNSDWEFLHKIHALIANKESELKSCSPSLQSPALYLALFHHVRMNNSTNPKLTRSILKDDSISIEKNETRLSKIMWPLVEGFTKLERYRKKMSHDEL